MRIAKNLRTRLRIPKTSGLVKSKNAVKTFLDQIFAFKRRRKYHRWIPVEPIIPKGKTKRVFEEVTNALEEFRCSLGVEPVPFYRLVSEFIVVPSGRKYYPFREIFSDENPASEEFITRIIDTLPWVTDLLSKDCTEIVRNFSKELSSRKIDSHAVFRSKDWFCVLAIKEMASKKGWSEEDLLNRIQKYYKRRMKKVTPEMVLGDLAHHELDKLDLLNEVKKSKKKRVGDLLREVDGYEEWRKGLDEL